MEQQPKRTEVIMPNHPVRYVVVYPDRAEVTREVRLQLEVGENEVVLKNISKAIDKDSVRVDGVGAASITEVSFQELSITSEEEANKMDPDTEVSKLQEELASLKQRKSELQQKKTRTESQQQLMDNYCQSLIDSSKSAGTGTLLSSKTIDGVFSFMDTYEERSVELKTSLYDIEQQMKELSTKIDELQNHLHKLKPGTVKENDQPVKETVIGILLTVNEGGEIVFKVSYVVSNASWTPKYDLRVSSAERTMVVSYFGMVQQNTGEDWVDAKLSLSTASPSIGGVPPKLETCKLTLLHYEEPQRKSKGMVRTYYSFGSGGALQPMKRLGAARSAPPLATPQAKVTEGLSSSVFEITVPATIPSDNSAHKVSVATINLTPTFEYETVPKLSQHVFLKAKVKNNSRYPLLAGPANAFLDQSFVTSTSIANVSPNEEFSCSLGTDASVRVVYKPVRRYREQTGIVSKSVVYTYKQVTEITNNRQEPAIVTFTDQIPLSRNASLKVTLQEPEVVKPKPGHPPPNPQLTSQNHVVWTMELQAGERREVNVHYKVEYPSKQQIEGL